jgi:hypothetical protein
MSYFLQRHCIVCSSSIYRLHLLYLQTLLVYVLYFNVTIDKVVANYYLYCVYVYDIQNIRHFVFGTDFITGYIR